MKVEIKNLEKDPENPRLTEDEEYIKALGKSFKGHQKFIDKPKMRDNPSKSGKYFVWDGWHRVLAAKEIGLKEIECDYLNVTIQGIHRELATKQIMKKDLNIWERGKLFAQIIADEKISESELGRKYGFNQSYISRSIKVYEHFSEDQARLFNLHNRSDQVWLSLADLDTENLDKMIETADSNIKDMELLKVKAKSVAIQDLNGAEREEIQKKITEEFGEKLYTYQVADPNKVAYRMAELEGDSHSLSSIKIPFEEGQTIQKMTELAKKLGGRFVGESHFWELEVDMVKYKAELEKAEWDEVHEKERIRKEREGKKE